MKKIKLIAILGAGLLLFSGCDTFLDTTPDNRAEVDTAAKVKQLLISAYPDNQVCAALEYSTDNVMDNGTQYSTIPNHLIEQAYYMEPVTEGSNDNPSNFWDASYGAIAAANQALASIAEIDEDSEMLDALRGEALICRAWNHFALSLAFCQAYSPENAETDLGLPFMEHSETEVSPEYTRGTLQELYENIAKDIEEGLPLINDAIYDQPKYHFNKRAAYAMATRFYLNYQKWDKAIACADEVLGTTPASLLRDWDSWLNDHSSTNDWINAYITASSPANLLIDITYGTPTRWMYASGARYNHSVVVGEHETLRATSLWSTSTSPYRDLLPAVLAYSSPQSLAFLTLPEKFEVTDEVAQTGYAHTVYIPLTTNKVILERAEAYCINGELDKAVTDINYWLGSTLKSKSQYTRTEIVDFMKAIPDMPVVPADDDQRTIKKAIDPVGFTIADGDQSELIKFILYLKRINTIHQGERMQDLKRYGIEYSHNVDKGDPIIVKKRDLREVLQLPQEVISAGLEANPRS